MQIINLSKHFGDNKAVNNISLNIDKPQMIGVIGRSGAGKSTMLRIINRLTDATSGKIIVKDENILDFKKNKKRAWQKNCAMIFQQFNLIPRLDVLTNVILGTLNEQSFFKSSLKIFNKEERIEALINLDKLGMAETALQRAETLSGGQQQRVAICRALMQNPSLILADEPIASLDPYNARLVMESLQKIHKEKNITIICNLHTLDTAKKYCDRIIGMKTGNIVFDDQPELLKDETARDIYGAEAEEAFEAAITSTSLGDNQERLIGKKKKEGLD